MGSKNKVLMEGAMELKEAVTYLETLVSTLKTENRPHAAGRGRGDASDPPPSWTWRSRPPRKRARRNCPSNWAWSSDPKYGLPEDISISGEEPKLDIA